MGIIAGRGSGDFMKHELIKTSLLDVYKSLFNFNHDACYALNLEGEFLLFNEAAAEISGYSKEEAMNIKFSSVIHKEFLEKTMAHFQRVTTGNRERFETAIMKKETGERVDLHLTAVPIIVDEKIIGVVGCAENITKKKELEKVLREQNYILEKIAKGAPFSEVLDSIVLFIESFSNGARCSILLADKEGKQLLHGSSPNLPAAYNAAVNGIPIGPSVGSCGTAAYLKRPITVTDIEKDPLWCNYKDLALSFGLRSCWSTPVFDNHQNVIGTFGMYYDRPSCPKKKDLQTIKKATDLTSLAIQHYAAKDKINFMAYHDALTSLPNRRLFDQKVREAIKNNRTSEGEKLCLMYLDLDRFKMVNDSLGHTMGDKLLKYVSMKLKNCLGDGASFSRQGGDEFTILLERTTKDEATEIGQKILRTLGEVVDIDGNEIFITTSIGVSFYPEDGQDVDVLLAKADVAMYQAKKQGRNNLQAYDVRLDKKALEKLQIENELRKALERDEFTLHYQPIFSLESNEVRGAEALIRWENEKCGNVSPQQFIPIAEETGLIVSIGEWVLKTALQELKRWHLLGMDSMSISVNLSMRQFYQHNLIQMISETLMETGIEARFLTIEITESMTMDVEAASIILHELKVLGVNISIDDFGTGYSSLNYLKRFPIDHLKIDRSFIRDITESKSDERIATTIILMAHNLGLSVIAEGVETAQQLEVLKQHGCNKAQGYFFSKPVSAQQFVEFGKQRMELVCQP